MIVDDNLVDKDFLQTQNFWGDHRLKTYEVFKRGSQMRCIYCGAPADTREHCPSRSFLKEPRPCDLPILPSCNKCNNSFSADELYLKYYIVFMKAAWKGNKPEIKEKLKTHPEVIKAKKNVNNVLKSGKIAFDSKIGRVLEKLARGHCVYELTEAYYDCQWELKEIRYSFRSVVKEEEWGSIEREEYLSDMVLPELGSRLYRNLFVEATESEEVVNTNGQWTKQIMLLWNIVQPENYEYVTYINRDHEMIVKIIIMDFLYAEITFGERW